MPKKRAMWSEVIWWQCPYCRHSNTEFGLIITQPHDHRCNKCGKVATLHPEDEQ